MVVVIAFQKTNQKIVIENKNFQGIMMAIENEEDFIFVSSKDSCPYCVKLFEEINNERFEEKVNIYSLNLKKLSSNQLKLIKEVFKNADTVPHSYKIEDGIVIDDYIGYNEKEHFKKWLRLHK